MGELLLIGGALLAAGVVVALVSARAGFPALIGFLGLGMLLGSEGPGGIDFDDAELAQAIGVVALVAILFEGGLTTNWRAVRAVLPPAAVLATLGVVVTAAVTGGAAYLVFDLSFTTALLLGAVIASTDAAAVFLALRSSKLRRRLAGLLELESGTNDPMAVALTLGLIAVLTVDGHGPGDIALSLALQLGVGALVGIGVGEAAARSVNRLPRAVLPFAPVASIGLAAFSFGAADVIGGSGFLAVYIVGLRLGNAPSAFRSAILSVHQGLAYLAQIALFVTLGLLVFPSELLPVVLPALALTAVLILVARPVSVWLSLVGQGFTWREKLLVSWAGLRGAVPIVLATFPPTEGVADSNTIFNAVFFVVLASALIQGPTMEPLARWLGLTSGEGSLPRIPREVGAVGDADVIEYAAAAGDAIVGRRVRDSGLPRSALVAVIARDEGAVLPRGSTIVEEGDRLYILVQARDRAAVESLLVLWESGPLSEPTDAPAADQPVGAPSAVGTGPVDGVRMVTTAEGGVLGVLGGRDAVTISLQGDGDADGGAVVLSAASAAALGRVLAGVPGQGDEGGSPPPAWETLPGLGERMRVPGSGRTGITVVRGRGVGRWEIYLSDPDRGGGVTSLEEGEARAVGAALLAAVTAGAPEGRPRAEPEWMW